MVKLRKQSANHIRLGQILPESPDGRGVGYFADSMESKEAGKGVPIENLKLHSLIVQVVQRLQDERLEQQNDIKPLGPCRRFLVLFSGLFKSWPERFPVNGSVDLFQRITCLVDTLKTGGEGEKSKLYHVGLH
jgi:hypothetical protein